MKRKKDHPSDNIRFTQANEAVKKSKFEMDAEEKLQKQNQLRPSLSLAAALMSDHSSNFLITLATAAAAATAASTSSVTLSKENGSTGEHFQGGIGLYSCRNQIP